MPLAVEITVTVCGNGLVIDVCDRLKIGGSGKYGSDRSGKAFQQQRQDTVAHEIALIVV